MKQYPTVTVSWRVSGPRHVGSSNDPVYDEIVMKDEIPDLPAGTYALAPVDALVIERDEDGQWPMSVVLETAGLWHGQGWWDQARIVDREEVTRTVRGWLDTLAGPREEA